MCSHTSEELDKIELDMYREKCPQLQKENQDFLDTFEAIYTKLGLTEGNTNGKELVSVTVKRHIDQIVDEYDFLVEEMKRSQKLKIALRKAILTQVKNEFPDNKELIAFWEVDNDEK